MFRITSLFIVLLVFASCGSKKRTVKSKTYKVSVAADSTIPKKNTVERKKPVRKEALKKTAKADAIINTALSFSGVRYQFGGTTKKGMDCSGLLYVSFGAHDVYLPRVSYDMANEGRRIRLQQATKGDLLFFKTSRRGKRINHVGMVVSNEKNEIKFIHASSSRGVTISSLKEGYWKSAFVKITRVL